MTKQRILFLLIVLSIFFVSCSKPKATLVPEKTATIAVVSKTTTLAPTLLVSNTITPTVTLKPTTTVTPTLAIRPTATLEVPVVWGQIYYDDFSDDSSGFPTEVDQNDKDLAFVGYGDNSFSIEVYKNSWVYPVVLADKTYKTVRVEFDANAVNSKDTNVGYGVVFRLTGNNSDNYSYYSCMVDSKGNWYILKSTNGNVEVVKTGNSKDINIGNKTNRLRIEIKGSKLNFVINDKWNADFQDNDFQNGSIGFIVAKFGKAGKKAQASFSDLHIYGPQ